MSQPSTSRRTLLLGGLAVGGTVLLDPEVARAAAPGVRRPGGPDRLDRKGLPLPQDASALPNTAGATGRESTAATARAAAPPNHPTATFPTLRAGTRSWDTRALQYLLLAAGHSTNWEETYGASTTAAVRAYQKAVKLPVTGVADPATLKRLAAATGSGAKSYRVYAIQTLLRKHGYRMNESGTPAMSTNYGPVTVQYVKSFQAGHGIGPATFVGEVTWPTLFAAVSSPPLYALMQKDTGRAQWANCGPVSAVTLLIHRGITPRGWTGNPATRSAAVTNFRYSAMGLANTAERDKKGSELPDFVKAFGSYGLTASGGSIEDTLSRARSGVATIAGGDAYRLPWTNHARSAVSHWIAVLGYDGTSYLAMDPLSTAATNVIHRISAAQLRTYAATNPGHPVETAKRNSILIG